MSDWTPYPDGLTGKELYDKFKRFMAEQACTIDDWEDLEDIDRIAWCRLALDVTPPGDV